MKHWTYAIDDVLYLRCAPTASSEYDGQPCIVFARCDGVLNPDSGQPLDTFGSAYVVQFADGAHMVVLEHELHPLGRRTWVH